MSSSCGRSDFCRVALPLSLTVCMLATGCTPPIKPKSDTIRPVKTLVVSAGGETHERTFPGKVEA
jgi:hypothetical protein